jgi:hypothetical protein
VRNEIEAEYRRDQAGEVFGDRQEQLQQKLESGTTDLDALAKQFDLQTGEIADFTRTNGGAPLGGKPAMLAAVFNDDVLAAINWAARWRLPTISWWCSRYWSTTHARPSADWQRARRGDRRDPQEREHRSRQSGRRMQPSSSSTRARDSMRLQRAWV